jgi:hypothetical protein
VQLGIYRFPFDFELGERPNRSSFVSADVRPSILCRDRRAVCWQSVPATLRMRDKVLSMQAPPRIGCCVQRR